MSSLVDNVLFSVRRGYADPRTGEMTEEAAVEKLNDLTNMEILDLIADAIETELEALRGRA